MAHMSRVISTMCWEPQTMPHVGGEAGRTPTAPHRTQYGTSTSSPAAPPPPGREMHTDTRTPFPLGGRMGGPVGCVVSTESSEAAASPQGANV